MDLDIRKWLKLDESTVSTVLGFVVVVVTLGLVINYFKTSRKPAQVVVPTPTPGAVKLVEKEGKIVPESLPGTHTVVRGEHLWAIATRYYTSGYNWVDIAKANNLKSPYVLYTGQSLKLPQVPVREVKKVANTSSSATSQLPSITGDKYTVARGDSLWKIAVRAYGDGYKWTAIAKANNLTNPGIIFAGRVLTLPR